MSGCFRLSSRVSAADSRLSSPDDRHSLSCLRHSGRRFVGNTLFGLAVVNLPARTVRNFTVGAVIACGQCRATWITNSRAGTSSLRPGYAAVKRCFFMVVLQLTRGANGQHAAQHVIAEKIVMEQGGQSMERGQNNYAQATLLCNSPRACLSRGSTCTHPLRSNRPKKPKGSCCAQRNIKPSTICVNSSR